jgi:phosphotransferase system  glucose/maltose/N-acetylglucosamine-specific IIC component
MFNQNKDKDERAISIEKSSYSLAYKIISFAILVDVMYRSFVLQQASWDLLGLVIVGGLIATLYQIHYKAATRSWVKAILLATISALIVAAVIMVVLSLR